MHTHRHQKKAKNNYKNIQTKHILQSPFLDLSKYLFVFVQMLLVSCLGDTWRTGGSMWASASGLLSLIGPFLTASLNIESAVNQFELISMFQLKSSSAARKRETKGTVQHSNTHSPLVVLLFDWWSLAVVLYQGGGCECARDFLIFWSFHWLEMQNGGWGRRGGGQAPFFKINSLDSDGSLVFLVQGLNTVWRWT